MFFPALEKYLVQLHRTQPTAARVWLDGHGRALGRYFNATLTSAFQPIHILGTQRIAGFEALVRSYSKSKSMAPAGPSRQ